MEQGTSDGLEPFLKTDFLHNLHFNLETNLSTTDTFSRSKSEH